ncbi:MAG: hypothetical protein AB7J13_07685 [Pyrinomonadaceae bacterium]
MFDPSSRRVRVTEGKRHDKGKLQIAIEMDGVGNESALSFTPRYDPTMLPHPVVTSAAGDASDGRLGIMVDSTQPLTSEIVTITFDLREKGFFKAVFFDFDSSLTSVALADFFGERIPIVFEPSRIWIRPTE